MSLAAQNVAPQLLAAAGQTVFPFAWRCDDAATVAVYVNDVQDGGFAVALNGDQTAAPGGTITRAACLGGEVVTVERQSPQTQAAAFIKYGPFPASSVSNALDKVVMLLQEIAAKTLRTIFVKRSVLTKVNSLELPAPIGTGVAIGWATTDGGVHYHLDNIIPPASVVGVVQAATLVKNEAPTGAVNSTTGADGNGVFNVAHVPVSAALFDFLIDGVRQAPNRYVRVGAVVTFNSGFFPIAGSDIRADYFY